MQERALFPSCTMKDFKNTGMLRKWYSEHPCIYHLGSLQTLHFNFAKIWLEGLLHLLLKNRIPLRLFPCPCLRKLPWNQGFYVLPIASPVDRRERRHPHQRDGVPAAEQAAARGRGVPLLLSRLGLHHSQRGKASTELLHLSP